MKNSDNKPLLEEESPFTEVEILQWMQRELRKRLGADEA